MIEDGVVRVAVGIDEARCQDEAFGVGHGLSRSGLEISDGDDAVAIDSDIGRERWVAGAIHHCRTSYEGGREEDVGYSIGIGLALELIQVGQHNDGEILLGIADDESAEAHPTTAVGEPPAEGAVGLEAPTEAVGKRLTIVEGHGCPRLFEGRTADNLLGVESLVPEVEVVEGRVEPPRADDVVEYVVVVKHEAAFFSGISEDAIRDNGLGGVTHHRVFHAEWPEDVVLEELAE